MTNIDKSLADWYLPELPAKLTAIAVRGLDFEETVRVLISHRLAADVESSSQIQIAVADWLFYLVRRNIKRGHAFILDEVLATRHADCLGYAKLFSALGLRFGYELGIVEVLIDNAGRYVPHYVNFMRLSNGTFRFIDAWYGSTDIKHRRIGVLVNGKPRDIDREELDGISDFKGLTDPYLEAITLYIKGNRCLTRDELNEAIKLYSEAILLYPQNSRAFYNRAIARERVGEVVGARLDYAQAFMDEASLIRVLATTNELENLIKLDGKNIREEDQNIYLWYKGFKTGIPVNTEEIAQQCHIPLDKVKEIITRVENLCTV